MKEAKNAPAGAASANMAAPAGADKGAIMKPVNDYQGFHAPGLRFVNMGLWTYAHPGKLPADLPKEFWDEAKRSGFGLRDGACVIVVAGGAARLVVI